MKHEYEAKFTKIDIEDVHAKLVALGFTLIRPEFLMKRKTFYFPNGDKGKWGRVRDEGDKITATIKHVIDPKKIEGTLEAEIIIQDFDQGCQFLEMCGLVCAAYQENKREIWRSNECECVIDTWPGLSPFIEIEAASADIVKRISNALGFDFAKALYGGVAGVYEHEIGLKADIMANLPILTFDNLPIVD